MDSTEPKRKHLRGDSSSEDDAPRFTLETMATLPMLPDDVLLYIMKYLGPVELHNLSMTTDRFECLAADKNLWKIVDFRPHKLTSQQLLNYVNYFTKSMTFLAIRGFVSEAPDPKWKDEVVTPELLEEISAKCPALETLVLDEHFGMANKLCLETFPLTLRHLSMRGSVIANLDPECSYFHNLHVMLPYLKVLILSNCNWVSPHDFMAISKCYQLEELRMDGCLQLGECVPYTSLAARFGFCSLKILDLRNTRVGDSDVGIFNQARNLTHLYLQCPSENDVTCGLCQEPPCMVQPVTEDLLDSSVDDDDDDDDDNDDNVANPLLWETVPVISARYSEKTSSLGSRFLTESISDPSTSCHMSLRMGADGNGDPNLPRASTSYGTLDVVLNPPGPSNIIQKVELLKKHPLSDSDSSSDENCSSVSLPAPRSEWHKQTWTMEEGALLPTSKLSCVHETGGRGKKRRHSSSNRSIAPDEPSTSARSFIASKSGDSSKVRNVSVGSTSCSVNDRTRKLQEGYSLCQELKTVLHKPSASVEVNCRLGTTLSHNCNTEQGRNCLRTDHSSCCGPLDSGAARPRLRRLFRSPSPHESTISDLCIMSFVFKDSETGDARYVRIISPQLVSARPHLHTLVVKNYKMITDASLTYLLKLSSLRYLDVSGTSVTESGVLQFRLKRPDVEVISDYECLPI